MHGRDSCRSLSSDLTPIAGRPFILLCSIKSYIDIPFFSLSIKDTKLFLFSLLL